jgi:hypothetical protein
MQDWSSEACLAAGKLDSSSAAAAAAAGVVVLVASACDSLYGRVWSGCGCKITPDPVL